MSKDLIKTAAFFDLERTITRHAVEKEVYLEMYRRGILSLREIVRALWGYARYGMGILHDLEELRHQAAAAHRGYPVEQSRGYMDELFHLRLKAGIYREAIKAIAECRELNMEVYIISTTFDQYIEPYARYLGIARYQGIRLEREDGRFTGRIEGMVCHQEKKAAAVREIAGREGLDLSRCMAFGDSVNDRYMLETVGRPHTVNPDRRLRRIARERGWPILQWSGLLGENRYEQRGLQ